MLYNVDYISIIIYHAFIATYHLFYFKILFLHSCNHLICSFTYIKQTSHICGTIFLIVAKHLVMSHLHSLFFFILVIAGQPLIISQHIIHCCYNLYIYFWYFLYVPFPNLSGIDTMFYKKILFVTFPFPSYYVHFSYCIFISNLPFLVLYLFYFFCWHQAAAIYRKDHLVK